MKPTFDWLRLSNLWTLEHGLRASQSLSSVYTFSRAASGGEWGLTDQEFIEQWATALKTLPLACRAGAAAQSILESGWFAKRVMFGLKVPTDLGKVDGLGFMDFHPTKKAEEKATTEFDSTGALYHTSDTFLVGSVRDQLIAYVDNIQRVHPDAMKVRDAREYIHRLCTPVNGFRKAYSTAPWVDPVTKAPIYNPNSANCPKTWDEAWKEVAEGRVISLYYLSIQSLVDQYDLEVFSLA